MDTISLIKYEDSPDENEISVILSKTTLEQILKREIKKVTVKNRNSKINGFSSYALTNSGDTEQIKIKTKKINEKKTLEINLPNCIFEEVNNSPQIIHSYHLQTSFILNTTSYQKLTLCQKSLFYTQIQKKEIDKISKDLQKI